MLVSVKSIIVFLIVALLVQWIVNIGQFRYSHDFDSRLDSLNWRLSELSTVVDKTTTTVKSLENKIKELERSTERYISQSSRDVATDIQRQRERVDGEFHKIKAKLAELSDTLSTVSSIYNDVYSSQSKIQQLEQKINLNGKLLTDVTATIEKAVKTIENLKSSGQHSDLQNTVLTAPSQNINTVSLSGKEVGVVFVIDKIQDLNDATLLSEFAKNYNKLQDYKLSVVFAVKESPRQSSALDDFTKRVQQLRENGNKRLFVTTHPASGTAFSKLANSGVKTLTEKASKSFDSIVILTQDLILSTVGDVAQIAHALTKELNSAEGNVAVVGPKIAYENGEIYSVGQNFTVYPPLQGQKTNLYLPKQRLAGYSINDPRSTITEEVEAVLQYAMAIRTNAFTAINGFDEEIGSAALASTDLCLRLSSHQHHWKAQVVGSLVVWIRSEIYTEINSFDESSVIRFEDKWRKTLETVVEGRRQHHLSVMWDTYCGCTGWNIEVISYTSSLEDYVDMHVIGGDNCFCPGFPTSTSDAVERMRLKSFDKIHVWISHKPPDRYPSFPYNGLIQYASRPDYVIGRSMTESDTIPQQWVMNCNNKVDEIWVPSQFHVTVFTKAGVNPNKIHRIPLSLDVHLWDPAVTTPLAIHGRDKSKFAFLSVFKWEYRKGWDVLLRAYFTEFTAKDNVVLYLHTYLYLDSDPRNEQRIRYKINDYVRQLGLDSKNLPEVAILSNELLEFDMPKLYKAMDAFVLPSRGEGWGLPIMEAMAMELPVIATNWSGQSDYLQPEYAYPLEVENLVEVPTQPEFGHYAEPSVEHLKKLLREVYTNRDKAKAKGKLARAMVVEKCSNERVAKLILDRFAAIERTISGK